MSSPCGLGDHVVVQVLRGEGVLEPSGSSSVGLKSTRPPVMNPPLILHAEWRDRMEGQDRQAEMNG